jgi:DNA ligase 1
MDMQYSKLVDIYEKLESTTKRLEHTHIISEFLKNVQPEELNSIMLLLEGRIFPRWDEREIGMASKLMIKAISVATGVSKIEISSEWKKTGDLGTVSYNFIKRKKQFTLGSSDLNIDKVLKNLREIALISGIGTVDRKVGLVSELLTSAKPNEAKYIVRTILSDMRIGIGEGCIRDAIIWAYFGKDLGITYDKTENKIDMVGRDQYNAYLNIVQKAYDITNDFSSVAQAAKKYGLKGLENVEMKIGIPIKVMLALKVDNAVEAFEKCGMPAEVEYKYDGMRMQIHKDTDKVWIFTRRLENVTLQFPEVVECVKKYITEKKIILDSEAVGFSNKTGKYLPFQNISQRIKRKYGIDKMSENYPVEVNVFDVISLNGKSIAHLPFKERKVVLERVIKETPKKIIIAKSIITSKIQEVESFYRNALDSGNEGIMIKKLDAPYKPGGRVGYMVKLKPTKENLDLVVVGAEWGDGKRSEWLSSYIVACTDGDNLVEVGRVSTGLKEKSEEGFSFKEMTELLKPIIIKENDKTVLVKPKIIIEVGYEEIQNSPTYNSGYALRFPRVIKLREDLGLKDTATLADLRDVFNKQKK